MNSTRRSFIFLTVLFIAFGLLDSQVAEAEDRGSKDRPRIGLVLGGGGAKGAAHIGVLKVMEELKIPVDYVAGTSMGAIVGALYASGLSAEELEKVLTSIAWEEVFSGKPQRKDIDFRRKQEDYKILTPLSVGIKNNNVALPKGLINDLKVNLLFETLMLHVAEIDDFDNLPIPYRAVAADVETGEMVVIKNGRLADAARASMSVPGAFPPAEINGRFLIDGGIVRNLPVDIVREMGAEVVICVDVGKPLITREGLGNPFSVMNQMIDIMMKKNVAEQVESLGPKDVYIHPDLGELGSGDFDRGAEIARIGEKAAREHIESLKRYAVSAVEYAAFTSRHHAEPVQEMKISSVSVKVEGESKISPDVVAQRLKVKPGETLDAKALNEKADRIYGMGDFERVDLTAKKQQDGYDLDVKAREKSWGPNYLRFGIALESDFEGWSKYNILLDYTRRWMNHLGGEWKTQVNLGSPNGIYSEFYQPLTVRGLFFVAPYAAWTQEPIDVYQGDNKIAEFDITRTQGGIDLGIKPRIYGEGRVGLQYTRIKGSTRIGQFDLPDDSAIRGAIVTSGILDQIDNVNFPNKGYVARLESISSLESLGSDAGYNRVHMAGTAAFTFMRQTLLPTLKVGSRLGNELPLYDEFQLGGFLNLSGLRFNQIRGQHMALGKIISYHKVGESFIGDFYLGGSLETGNTWPDDFDFEDLVMAGSLFAGYDTLFGPLYLGIGQAEGGYTAGYFYLGRTF